MSAVGTINPLASTVDPAAGGLAELRRAAEGIVGSVFYGTLLKLQREAAIKGPYGHGGRGEEVFQAQLDQIYAEQAGRARAFNLTDAIVARYQGRVRTMAAAALGDGGES